MELFISLVPERQGLGLGHEAQSQLSRGSREPLGQMLSWGQGGYTGKVQGVSLGSQWECRKGNLWLSPLTHWCTWAGTHIFCLWGR